MGARLRDALSSESRARLCLRESVRAGGPKASWPATDLTIEATAGRISLQGDRDRPPIPVGYPQAAFHAGALAAADAVIALNEREISGRGQWIGLSMQEAMTWTLMSGPGYPSNLGRDPPGSGDDRATANLPPRLAPFLRDQWLRRWLCPRDLGWLRGGRPRQRHTPVPAP